jgi:hypothetical protein
MGEHRCEGRLRGFAAGHCRQRATVEYRGKWYCKRHDRTPKTSEEPLPYVWQLWQLGGSEFAVTRYSLVKMHPMGSVTVRVRGHDKVIRRMTGQHFFTSEADMLAHVRSVMTARLASVRRQAEAIAMNLERPDCGIVLECVPDHQKT